MYNIMAVVINHRSENAIEVQKTLTQNGCIIKMRMGLHEAGNFCSEEGLVILQIEGKDEQIEELKNKLNSIDGVRAEHLSI